MICIQFDIDDTERDDLCALLSHAADTAQSPTERSLAERLWRRAAEAEVVLQYRVTYIANHGKGRESEIATAVIEVESEEEAEERAFEGYREEGPEEGGLDWRPDPRASSAGLGPGEINVLELERIR